MGLAAAWETTAEHEDASARLTTTTQGPATLSPGSEVRRFGVEQGTVTGAVDIAWTDLEAVFGEAVLEDEGLVSVHTEGVSAGGHFWGFDETFTPVDPSLFEEDEA